MNTIAKNQKNFRFSSDMLEDLKAITDQLHCNDTQTLSYALQQTARQTKQNAQVSQRELNLMLSLKKSNKLYSIYLIFQNIYDMEMHNCSQLRNRYTRFGYFALIKE